MSLQTFSLPLFPLTAHILPGGMMSLRIFEARYVRMVKEACANQTGFAICMLNAQGNKEKNEHIYCVGTFVTVEDFDLLEDGFLGIKVKGHRCVKISDITTEKDQLRVGQCSWINNWSSKIDGAAIDPMDKRLKEIFDKYPEVNSLYPEPHFDDPIWVIYRWLELIPVNAEQKQQFLQSKDCTEALNFLTQLVE